VDDLKYLCKLESLVRQGSPSNPAIKSGQELLKSIENGIADDWTLYEGKSGLRFPDDGFAKLDPEKVSNFGKLNSLRMELVNAILAIQGSK
jgi:hypothetical protein